MLKKFAIVGSEGITYDSLSKHYPEIIKYLCEMGLTHTSIDDCEGLIFINYHRQSYIKYKNLGKDLQNLVLIRLEPFAVFPRQYSKSIESKFGLILDPGQGLGECDMKDFIGWPYKYHQNPALPNALNPSLLVASNNIRSYKNFTYENWEKKKSKIVLIAANKVSPTSKSNYKLRRKIAREMNPTEIDIYGDLWTSSVIEKIRHRIAIALNALKTGYMPNIAELYGCLLTHYPNAIGAVANKQVILRQYKYSLVVENSSTYCSEKLFDAILNGCIPIYVGPKNYEISLPANLFHWSNGSVDDIRSFVISLTPEKIKAMLKAMEDFTNSPTYIDSWDNDKVYFKIAKRIFAHWRIS